MQRRPIGTDPGGDVVGVVGLGAIGQPVAARLRSLGDPVVGFDTNPARVAAATARDIDVAESLDELWGRAGTIVLVVVRNADELAQVTNADGAPGRPRVVVVLSTVGPAAVERVARSLGERGVDLVDAPVSGGPSGAEHGRLTVMMAGSPGPAGVAADVLGRLGRVIAVGDEPGAGQAVKLANQVVMAGALAAAVEAVRLADAYNVDRQLLQDVLARSTGRSWAVDNLERVLAMWAEGREGPLGLLDKDLRLALEQAVGRGDPCEVTAAVVDRLSQL